MYSELGPFSEMPAPSSPSPQPPDPIATTARPAAFNADRMRVTSAGLNPDSISAVLNAEFGAMLPPVLPPLAISGAMPVFSVVGSSPASGTAFYTAK